MIREWRAYLPERVEPFEVVTIYPNHATYWIWRGEPIPISEQVARELVTDITLDRFRGVRSNIEYIESE